MSGDDRQFFVEQMDNTLKQIGELVAPIKDDLVDIKTKLLELDDIKDDVRTIKLAVKDTNKDISDHEERLASLEHHTV